MWCLRSQLLFPAAPKGGSWGASPKHRRMPLLSFSEIPRVGLGRESCFGFGKSCRIKAKGGLGPPGQGGGPGGHSGGWPSQSLSALLGDSQPTFPRNRGPATNALKPRTQPLPPGSTVPNNFQGCPETPRIELLLKHEHKIPAVNYHIKHSRCWREARGRGRLLPKQSGCPGDPAVGRLTLMTQKAMFSSGKQRN